jgi:hypothetical protein
MKKLLLFFILVAAGNISIPANAAPLEAVFSVASASTSDAAHNNASVSVGGTKAVGLISYTVTASASGESTLKLTVTPPSNSTTWSIPISGLTGGTSYSFIVTTTNSSGSTDSTPQTFIAKSVPLAPIAGSATPGVGKATLTWTPADNGGLSLTKYVISGGGKDYEVTDITKTSYEVSGLTPGQNVTFTIVAYNELGKSLSSSYSSIRIPAAPGAVSGVDAVSQSDGSVKVTWTAPTDDGGSTVTGYSVTLSPATGSDLTKTVLGTTQATFDNVAAGTWTAKVSATNLAGTGISTSDASPLVIASAPTSLTLAPNPTISGTAQVGQSLTVVRGTWDSGVTFTYQWNQDGSPISGATSASYTILSSDLGSTLSVSVTGTKSGYATTTKTSVSTAAVIAASSGNNNLNQGGGGSGGAPAPIVIMPSNPKSPVVVIPNSPNPQPVTKPNETILIPEKTIPKNDYVSSLPAGTKASSVVSVSNKSGSQAVQLTTGSSFKVSLPSLAKGVSVKQVLVGPNKKSYVLMSGKTSAAGELSSPVLMFAKPGTYTLTITAGKITKKITVKVK